MLNSTSYRPVRTLTYLSKIIEKLLISRLIRYLNKRKLLDKKQFGFQENNSTENTIVNLFEFFYDTINNNEYSFAVSKDHQKPFGIINHSLKKIYIDVELGVRF